MFVNNPRVKYFTEPCAVKPAAAETSKRPIFVKHTFAERKQTTAAQDGKEK